MGNRKRLLGLVLLAAPAVACGESFSKAPDPVADPSPDTAAAADPRPRGTAGPDASSSSSPSLPPPNGAPSTDASAPAAPVDSGAMTARVAQARRASSGPVTDALQLAVVLTNGATAAPIPLVPSLFQVETSDGILHAPEPAVRRWWVGGRVPDDSEALGPAASFTWRLAFRLGSATPVRLHVTTPDPAPRTATADVVLEACTPCGPRCTYLDVDPANCGACGVGLVPDTSGASGLSRCVDGKAVCAVPSTTACPSPGGLACVDLRVDGANCGACGNSSYAPCVAGTPTCDAPLTLARKPGGWTCVDLANATDDCGQPNRSCTAVVPGSSWPRCAAGKCSGALPYVPPANGPVACTAACAARGLVCDPVGFADDRGRRGGFRGVVMEHAYVTPCDANASTGGSINTACACEEP